MSPTVNEVELSAPPEQVFRVLSDPRTYPRWLVGAQRIRRVDPGWPAPGTAFHHTVGAGPLRISDKTSVLDHDPPHRLTLRAGAGRIGAATVRFVLTPTEAGTRLRFEEEPRQGPARALWRGLGKLTMWAGIKLRNEVSLDRLSELVTEGDEG